ncbi:hypothetical protein NKG94_47080 [Micromonospora sp. M12]
MVWLQLTDGPYPRLSIVRDLSPPTPRTSGRSPPGGRRAGRRRFPRRRAAAAVHAPPVAAHHHAGLRAGRAGPLPAPCEHKITPRSTTTAPPRPSAPPPPVTPAGGGRLLARIDVLSRDQRYEEAAVVRSRLAAVLRATVRMQRLAALTGIVELAAARLAARGGWELALVRHGRLAGAGVSRRSAPAPHVGSHPPPPRRCRAGTGRCRRPPPRSPSGSCPGWSDRRPDWWRCPRMVLPAGGAGGSVTCWRRPRAARPTNSRPNAHDQLTDRTTLTRLGC